MDNIINQKIEKYYKYADDKKYRGCKNCCIVATCGFPRKCCKQWYSTNTEIIEDILCECEKRYGFMIFMDEFTDGDNKK